MSSWLLSPLVPLHYGAILADPPWSFDAYSKAGEKKNAKRHYPCMAEDALAALPVGHLARGDCALFLWVTDPMLEVGLRVMRAWGFTYKTVAFTWAKRTMRDDGWHLGTGYWTRANPEQCLLGVVGKPKRLSAAVRQLVVDPVREHSRKPDRIHGDIEHLVGGPYCELFARAPRAGWDCWGNEVDKFTAAVAAPHGDSAAIVPDAASGPRHAHGGCRR